MATKRFYATRDLKNPSYGTRMLRACDPVDLDGPKSRLYLALGAVTAERPKAAPRLAQNEAEKTGALQAEAPKPKIKRAPRKKAAAKKK